MHAHFEFRFAVKLAFWKHRGEKTSPTAREVRTVMGDGLPVIGGTMLFTYPNKLGLGLGDSISLESNTKWPNDASHSELKSWILYLQIDKRLKVGYNQACMN